MTHRVLIVEDDPLLQNGMALLFSGEGHEVLTAGTIRRGLERLTEGPTLVLLDLNLPDGLGTTILRRIRQEKLPMLVAVLSATTDEAFACFSEGPAARSNVQEAGGVGAGFAVGWLR